MVNNEKYVYTLATGAMGSNEKKNRFFTASACTSGSEKEADHSGTTLDRFTATPDAEKVTRTYCTTLNQNGAAIVTADRTLTEQPVFICQVVYTEKG